MDAALVGPIGVRRFVLEKKCHTGALHSHNYDHTTIVIHGRIQISMVVDDVEQPSQEYSAGELVPIPAQSKHKIKALEDNSVYLCVFSHRDFEGLVSQWFVGNAAAYQ